MRYPPHILEEIRARLPASDVVGRRVRLKKAGREWRGLSPFNSEKTPSFYVNDQKQFYHCFSSGKHGDVFTFLMETEGLSFPEAVERLAGEAGVALPKMTTEAVEAETRRAGAIEVMEMAATFFEEQLRGRAGGDARAYLDRRALGDRVRQDFRLGYAPGERYGLRDHLAGKGVDRDLMLELGLLTTGEDVRVPYDKFRDRVIFPITDIRGRVIAFGGRAMRAEAKAKYLNSPDTPLFKKGQVLYNLHAARKTAHDRGAIICVEGYVDVIAMRLAGHPETVAPLGTALTEEQLALLWRYADEPILCFDGDKAGQRAAFRALDLALPMLQPSKSLRFALLPQGQDPDDLLRSGGASAIDAVLAGAGPLVEMLWARATETVPLDTPERRAGLARTLREAVAGIRDETVRRFYRDDMERRLRQLSWGSRERTTPQPAREAGFQRRGRPTDAPMSPRLTSKFNPLLASAKIPARGKEFVEREAMIVLAFLANSDLVSSLEEDFSNLDLLNIDAIIIRTFILNLFAETHDFEEGVILGRLEKENLMEAAARLLNTVRPGDRWVFQPNPDFLRLEQTVQQAMSLHRQAKSLTSELRQAQLALSAEASEIDQAWLFDVKDRQSVHAPAEIEVDNPASEEKS